MKLEANYDSVSSPIPTTYVRPQMWIKGQQAFLEHSVLYKTPQTLKGIWSEDGGGVIGKPGNKLD